MPDATLIDYIRHGQPVGGRKYRGQIDDPLSDLGWDQMWTAVGHGTPWQQIVTSPLRRCSEFAHALGTRHGIPVAEDPRLREVGFGEWEGQTASEIRDRSPEVMSRFYRDPVNNRPAGAEPLHQFSARVTGAFDDLVSNFRDQDVLVVAHAGVIRATLAHVLGAPLESMYRISVDVATIASFMVDAERPPTLVLQRRR